MIDDYKNGEITFEPVGEDRRTLLWNLFQKFLYEMTNYYDDPLDEDGILHYGHFDDYFGGEPGREALLIKQNKTMVGFIMLNRYSHIGADIDRAIAEFTVFPQFRKKHIATRAVQMLLSERPGRWEVKYNEQNIPAKALWNKITEEHSPKKTQLNEQETVINFTV